MDIIMRSPLFASLCNIFHLSLVSHAAAFGMFICLHRHGWRALRPEAPTLLASVVVAFLASTGVWLYHPEMAVMFGAPALINGVMCGITAKIVDDRLEVRTASEEKILTSIAFGDIIYTVTPRSD